MVSHLEEGPSMPFLSVKSLKPHYKSSVPGVVYCIMHHGFIAPYPSRLWETVWSVRPPCVLPCLPALLRPEVGTAWVGKAVGRREEVWRGEGEMAVPAWERSEEAVGWPRSRLRSVRARLLARRACCERAAARRGSR